MTQKWEDNYNVRDLVFSCIPDSYLSYHMRVDFRKYAISKRSAI